MDLNSDFSEREKHFQELLNALKDAMPVFQKLASADHESLSEEEKKLKIEIAAMFKAAMPMLEHVYNELMSELFSQCQDMFFHAKFKAAEGDENMNQIYLGLKDSYKAAMEDAQPLN